MPRVLVACEESQAVTIELRALGIEAYSCDTEECSGGHPEWHLKQDVLPLLDEEWYMILAFPPCTHLANSGNKWRKQKRADGREQEGIDFFMKFTDLKCEKVVIENPIGIMSTVYRKPDQIINPFNFGEPFTKPTCLWIKGLPLLTLPISTKDADKGKRHTTKSGKSLPEWYNLPPSEDRAKLRSRTFSGIAKAMATQWGELLLKESGETK